MQTLAFHGTNAAVGASGGALTMQAFAALFADPLEFDLADGNAQTVVLTANVLSSTIVKSSGAITEGELMVLRIVQDGTGGWLFNWPPTIRDAGTQPVKLSPNAITRAMLQYMEGAWEFVHPVV
jgi:hypothetical protein